MRIGIDARPLAVRTRTGVENYLHFLIENLRSVDEANEYLLFVDRPCLDGVTGIHGVEVVYVKDSAPWRIADTWMILDLPVALKKRGVDVFYSPDTKFPPVRGLGKIVTVHDLAWLYSGEGYTRSNIAKRRIWFALAARFAHRIIAVSEYTRKDVLAKYPGVAEKTIVVPEGVGQDFKVVQDPDRVRAACEKYAIEGKFILAVGATHYRRKNLEGLLRAYRHLRTSSEFAHSLAVVGEVRPDAGRLAESLLDERTARHVVFTGYVDQADLVLLLNGADVLVYPSLYEGFGLPVLEAMACGLPVVTSSTTSLPEVVGDAGLLADPRSHTAIADAIHRVLSDSGLRDSLIRKGLLRAARFTWRRMAEGISGEIEAVARQR